MNLTYEEFMKLVAAAPDIPPKNDEFPVTAVLNILQGKWNGYILFFLCKKGCCRFGEIHKAYPQISKTMLSSVLKQLEAYGLLIRTQYNEIPPHTEYSITTKGKELMPIFYEMYKWGVKYGSKHEYSKEETK